MDQQLELRNHASIIGPVTDFAYRWGLKVGLSDEKARRLALAVDELVTDVVRFAYPGDDDVETLHDPPVLFHEMVSVIDLETVFDVEVAAVGDRSENHV